MMIKKAKKKNNAVATSRDQQTTRITEDRTRAIAVAAYFRAENRGFDGDPVQDWLSAEKELGGDSSQDTSSQ
jgi:hypothetical protein